MLLPVLSLEGQLTKQRPVCRLQPSSPPFLFHLKLDHIKLHRPSLAQRRGEVNKSANIPEISIRERTPDGPALLSLHWTAEKYKGSNRRSVVLRSCRCGLVGLTGHQSKSQSSITSQITRLTSVKPLQPPSHLPEFVLWS